jgi:hypothetical protein
VRKRRGRKPKGDGNGAGDMTGADWKDAMRKILTDKRTQLETELSKVERAMEAVDAL